ncbi:TetR/AcrR family transcriptional regulator [Nocardiopsis gilva YIM 90087]|uniref:TetR/AcrR family transcriptional regulator n=1 Tax=Nocardiopsis gilva YIM 90087 TaxID=1235441 RepID=A0A223S332_9ACTN|nr:TetR/AcrR family transcriptional regulator [Nocardiopsis gilva]ASU82531.1 TetR/AcrR family transcriptional regulator [Nocardiopsis gilva YIM 90087]
MSETVVRRRRGQGSARRNEILAAAIEEFAAGGYKGTSLATVAERVGLTQQGLLHYFPSKEALLVAVLEKRDEMDAAMGDSPRDLADFAEVVTRNTDRRELVQLHTVLSAEGVTEHHPAHNYFHSRYMGLRDRTTEQLRERHGDTLPSGLAPEDAAALVIAAMDGLRLQWLYDPDSVQMPGLIKMLADVLTSPARGGNPGAAED